MLGKILKENLIFLIVALAPYVGEPANVHAQTGTMNPLLFTEPLTLSRGVISPKFEKSLYLTKKDYCDLIKSNWGWSSCEGIDAFLISTTPDTDTLLITKANSEGYVKYDDWNSSDKDEAISDIEKSLHKSMEAQSEKLGIEVKFLGWRSYPILDQSSNILFYATDVSFDDEVMINIKASIFDRRGYITFLIVPTAKDLNQSQIKNLVLQNADLYKSNVSEKYAAFSSGDKVAATGAVGVLATLVGVKYGKAAITGFLAVFLAFAKKAAFLLLIPVFWFFSFVKQIIFPKKADDR